MYQCIRTTLIHHPDDIRGRRRANEARKILLYDVFQDEDIFHTIEVKVDNCINFCCGTTIKRWFNELCTFVNVAKKVVLFGADMFSDIALVVILWKAIDYINHLKTLTLEDNLYKNGTEIMLTENEMITNKSSEAFAKCQNISEDHSLKVEDHLIFLDDILSKYRWQLIAALSTSLMQQFVLQVKQIQLQGSAGINLKRCVSGISRFVVLPIALFRDMWKNLRYLNNPAKEDEMYYSKDKKKVMKQFMKNR